MHGQAVVTQRARLQAPRRELGGEERQRADRRTPRARVRLAVGVVQQHRAAVDVAVEHVVRRRGRRLGPPVTPPRGPQHGREPGCRAASRAPTERMPNGGRNQTGSTPVAATISRARRMSSRSSRSAAQQLRC